MERLKPLKEARPPEVPYEEIRLVIARLRSEAAQNSGEAALAGSIPKAKYDTLCETEFGV